MRMVSKEELGKLCCDGCDTISVKMTARSGIVLGLQPERLEL
jgi:hypothetical protein